MMKTLIQVIGLLIMIVLFFLPVIIAFITWNFWYIMLYIVWFWVWLFIAQFIAHLIG